MPADRDFPQPRIVISRCIDFDACRYNGQTIHASLREQLEPYVEFVPICPELEIGLGVPREPVRLVRDGTQMRMVQPATSRDLTSTMNGWSQGWLESVDAIDGFILKAKSPSCGIDNAKFYANESDETPLGRAAGLFATNVARTHAGAAVIDEGRLRNPELREHFLTKIYTLADFRSAHEIGTAQALSDFQARTKLVLMAHDQVRMRSLGRIASNTGDRATSDAFDEYGHELAEALARPAPPPAHINVLMHALGYFSDRVGPAEKRQLLDVLDDYRAGRVPLSTPQAVIASWLARFDLPYLAGQSYFAPFPKELISN